MRWSEEVLNLSLSAFKVELLRRFDFGTTPEAQAIGTTYSDLMSRLNGRRCVMSISTTSKRNQWLNLPLRYDLMMTSVLLRACSRRE